mgnify:CR=1 FL=1
MTDLEQIRALAAQGIGRLGVEAVIGRRLEPAELTAFRKAEAVRKLRVAQKKARGPKTTAERVAEHVARHNDVAGFDARPRHPRLKASCRLDLARFMWYYCRAVVKHRPPPLIRDGLIRDVQDAVLNGGQDVKLYGRGTGKTTVIVFCASLWATLYGHRRYPIIVSATGKLAAKNLKVIKKLLMSDAIRADFPAVAVPIRALGGISQRTASQTYDGTPTGIEWATDQIVFPMCRSKSGAPLDAGCGAIIGAVGIGGAVRGANESGQRPDFLLLDDPQTRKAAHSPAMVAAIIDYIHDDALMLAGHDSTLAAFVLITPQCFGDVATELCSRSKHPEWDITVEPFMRRRCPNWSRLALAFCEQFVADAAAHDKQRTRSTRWYLDHRAEFAEVEVLDPFQFDSRNEVDVVHHLLNLRAKLGERAFEAEIMMNVSDAASALDINADRIAERLNGAPPNVLPPGTDSVVVFCDVNITAARGLSWAAVAFGPHRVAAVVNYGRYPAAGPLVPPNASDLVRNRLVAAGIRAVVETVAALRFRDAKGRRVTVTALGFDRGYLPAVIHRTLYVLRKTRPIPFPLVAVRGFPWDKFGVREKDTLRRGDHVFATRSQYGQYLAEMAPYWREIMQSGFLETPLQPGSLSLFGSDPTRHFAFAAEVANERLVRKFLVARGGKTLTAWDWQTLGENHFCDCLTGCFALASWYHCYDNLSQVIDGVLTDPASPFPEPDARAGSAAVASAVASLPTPPAFRQDDLFDPSRNPAIVANAGYPAAPVHVPSPAYSGTSDETEGTLDPDVAPYPPDVEATASPLQPLPRVVASSTDSPALLRASVPPCEASPSPDARAGSAAVLPLSSRCRKFVYKFKKGRYKK